MDRALFSERAQAACVHAVEFARQFVVQALPNEYLLHVFPNSSCDHNLVDGEVVYPDESLPEHSFLGPMPVDDFVDRFWRAGLVPEWIDVNVTGLRDNVTLLEVLVCGRFTAHEHLLYHRDRGIPPFHVVGPCLPPEWHDGVTTPFDVNWLHLRREAHRKRQSAG
jgi:hypothetical protein